MTIDEKRKLLLEKVAELNRGQFAIFIRDWHGDEWLMDMFRDSLLNLDNETEIDEGLANVEHIKRFI